MKLPTSSPNHHHETTTSSSSGRFPNSRPRQPSGSSTQPRVNITGEDSEAKRPVLLAVPPPYRSLSADSLEQQEENNPFDTPERQASIHHTPKRRRERRCYVPLVPPIRISSSWRGLADDYTPSDSRLYPSSLSLNDTSNAWRLLLQPAEKKSDISSPVTTIRLPRLAPLP